MQADAANETKLPRALIKRNAELKLKYGGPVSQQPEPENPEAVEATPAEAVVTTVEPTPTPAPAGAADPRETDPEYWKQRFLVTNGILRKERDDRKMQATELTQRINELMVELQAARDSAPSGPIDLGEYFTPEQIEEIGEPAALAMATTIKQQIRNEVSKAIKTQVEPLRTAKETEVADRQQERMQAFTDRLAELVPNYVEIDESDEWKAWLMEENEDGIERQEVLNKHIKVLNADRVAGMFRAFLTPKTRPTPPITPNGTGATPAAAVARQNPLTRPTPAEIKEFYKRAKLNKVTPQERARFDERMALQ